jgi:RND family efflux transporter MFP subunit
MYKFYLLPLLAIIGIAFAIRTVVAGSVPAPVPAPVVNPPHSPYPSFIAGAGIIEASSENIAIAPPIAGVVSQVLVKSGDPVQQGQALFVLDDRDVRAELRVRKAQVELAKAEQSDAETQLNIYQTVADVRAQSKGELLKRQSAVAVAKAKVSEAESQVQATETTLSRLTVHAPIDGQVLQVKVRAGEFAPAQALSTPLMLLGSVTPLVVRVDVDDNDAWRVKSNSDATAVLRGNTGISFPLKFVRFEPYVIPKRSLTGESTERVDTRVLQVLYAFERKNLPEYVGQLLDVFIQDESASAGKNS